MNLTIEQIEQREQLKSEKLIFLKEDDYEGVVEQEFTSSQKENIKAYIDYLYASPKAREIFNQIEEPIQILAHHTFGALTNFGGNFFTPKPLVTFDMSVFSDEPSEKFREGYISETGEFVKYDVRLAFMHEVIHAITGLTDNEGQRGFTSGADSAGETQVEANKIHAELGAPLRISYDGRRKFHEPNEEPIGSSIETGTQFTKGKIVGVENSIINIGTFVIQDVDTSHNSPVTNDLLIYSSSNNRTFITGEGNDYLYGGNGNDTLNSGSDNDYLLLHR